MAYRQDVDALRAKVEALDGEVKRAELAREDAQRTYDAARARNRLPVLEDLRIAAPCNAAWSEMQGDERVRHCVACDLKVYDLTAMSRAEAEALVQNTEGRTCVRFYKRTDGTVLTSDCPTGVRWRRVRRVAIGAGVMLAAFGALATVAMAQMGAVAPPASRVEAVGEPQAAPVVAPPAATTPRR